MQYKDDLAQGYVNGYYVGIKQGSPTQDALEAQGDGHAVQRETVRIGTVTPDAAEPNYPVPQDYTVTYVKGEAAATGTAPTETNKVEGATFTAKSNTFTFASHVFVGWLGSDGNTYQPNATVTMPGATFTLTAQWEES
jgi:uncharacterized repeat protein (TIGR02543 family)